VKADLMWGQPPPAVRRAQLDLLLLVSSHPSWACHPERSAGKRSAAATQSKDLCNLIRLRPSRKFVSPTRSNWLCKKAAKRWKNAADGASRGYEKDESSKPRRAERKVLSLRAWGAVDSFDRPRYPQSLSAKGASSPRKGPCPPWSTIDEGHEPSFSLPECGLQAHW